MNNEDSNDVLVSDNNDNPEEVDAETNKADELPEAQEEINAVKNIKNDNNKNIIIAVLSVALIAVVITGLFYFFQNNGTEDELVASVNGEKITKEVFFQEMYKYYGDDFLDDFIKRTLIMQEAERRGLVVSEDDVDDEISEIVNQFGSEEEFHSILEEYGDTIEDLRERIEIDKLLKKVVMSEIDIDDQELESFFIENRQWFDDPEEIRLQHILLDTEEEAEEVTRRLEEGESFEDLVTEFTKDDFTRDEGGDLGYAMRGDLTQQFDEEFEEVAFSLGEGEFSRPVESYRGLHVIKVTEYLEGRTVEFQDVREEVEEAFLSERMGPKIGEILEKLEEEADIKIYM